MEIFVLDIDHKKNIVRIWGRDTENNKVCIQTIYEYYVYILPKEEYLQEIKTLLEEQPYVKKIEVENKKYFGKQYKAIKTFLDHRDYNKLKSLVDTLKDKGKIDGKKEVDIPIHKKFIIDNKVYPLTWYDFELEFIDKKRNISYYKLKNINRIVNKPLKLKAIAIDIEVLSQKAMPDPKQDPVISIALYSDNFKKVITWKGSSNEDVVVTRGEYEMFEQLNKLLKEIDPDIIVGYNSNNFDFSYLYERAKVLNFEFTFGWDGKGFILTKKGEEKRFRITGLQHIDLYKVITNLFSGQLKSETYTLDEVAREILGYGKEDMDLNKMYNLWQENKIGQIATYNLKDAELTYRLFKHFEKILIELSRITGLTLYEVSNATYGQLVENYLIKRSRDFNEIVPNRPKQEDVERRRMITYKGAFVLEPKPGLYENIVVYDFRSLYPSIIIKYNISFDTLKCEHKDCKEKNIVDIETSLGKDIVWFCTKQTGVIPSILKEIFEERTQLKKELKYLDPNSEEYLVTNARQYALKILANSMYGYLGFPNSRWYCLECAAAVTALGRKHIQEIIRLAQEKGYKPIYGDSITKDRLIPILYPDGLIKIKPIEEFFEEVVKKYRIEKIGDKEYVYLKDNYFTLSKINGEDKWSKIYYVVRHKANKKIYRIWQKYGETVVTEDHSIIGNDLRSYTPKEIVEKRIELLRVNKIERKKILEELDLLDWIELPEDFEYDEKWIIWKYGKEMKIKRKYRGEDLKRLLRIMALYLSRGSLSEECLQISSESKELLEKIKEDFEEITKNILFSIKDSKKQYFKLETNSRLVLYILYLLCGEDEENKRILDPIFNLPEECIREFLEYLILGGGSKWPDKRYSKKYNSTHFRYYSTSLNLISGVSFLLTLVGYKYTISYRPHKNEYKISITTKNYNKRLDIRIKEESYGDYVYDLGTEDSMFVDACGMIYLHNTDSIFILVNNKDNALKFLEEANKILPDPLELDLEDFYIRGIFVAKRSKEAGAKKKYALLSESGKIKLRGFEVVRRDWAPIAKEAQETVIDILLREGDVNKLINYLKDLIQKVKNKELPLEKFIIREQLRKRLEEYKVDAPHVVAAKKYKLKGYKVRSGFIVEYVICQGGGKISDKVKLPEECKGKEYDPDYYINRQIFPAVESILHALKISKEQIISKQKTIMDFFRKLRDRGNL